jgi:hypothetical protein
MLTLSRGLASGDACSTDAFQISFRKTRVYCPAGSHHGLQLALVPRKFCQARPRRRVCTAKAQEAYPQSQDGKKQEQVICGPSRRQLLIATTGGWVGLGSDGGVSTL